MKGQTFLQSFISINMNLSEILWFLRWTFTKENLKLFSLCTEKTNSIGKQIDCFVYCVNATMNTIHIWHILTIDYLKDFNLCNIIFCNTQTAIREGWSMFWNIQCNHIIIFLLVVDCYLPWMNDYLPWLNGLIEILHACKINMLFTR